MIQSIGDIKKVTIDHTNLIGGKKKKKQTRKHRLTKSVRKAINVIKNNTIKNKEKSSKIALQQFTLSNSHQTLVGEPKKTHLPSIQLKKTPKNNLKIDETYTYPRGILRGGRKFVPRKTVHNNKTRKQKRFRVFKNEGDFKNTLSRKYEKKSLISPTIELIKYKNPKHKRSKTRKRNYTFNVEEHQKSIKTLSNTPSVEKNKPKQKKREFLILNNIISPQSKLTNFELLHDALKTDTNDFIITRE
jgi:hypothetical protein